MTIEYNFKKEWPKMKKQLIHFSKEALVLAKKGEKEIVQLSKRGKIHLDVAALGLKKEHLFHLIGKAYVKAQYPGPHNPEIEKLIAELEKVDKQISFLKKKTSSPITRKPQSRIDRSPGASTTPGQELESSQDAENT